MATVPTTIDDLSTTVNDNWPAQSDSVAPSLDDVLRLHAGSIADIRDNQREAFVALEDKRFGGAGDDATNNATPMSLAIAAGGVVQLGTGTYRFVVSGSDGIVVPTSLRIRGQGKARTILKFVCSGASDKSLIRVSSGSLHIEGVSIEVVNNDNARIFMFDGGGLSNFVARDCKFDGGVTNVGPAVTYRAFGLRVRDSAVLSNIVVENCEIRRFWWFFSKNNSGTTDQSRIRFMYNDFSEHYRTPLLFNTPSADINDVIVHGNTFRDNLASSASLKNAFHIAVDGTNIRITDNHMSGVVQEAIHIEEGPDRMVISGNTIEVDGDGIFFTDNDNGGVDHSAEDIIVANNIIVKTGTNREAGTYGIWLVNDDGGEILDDDGNPTGVFRPVYTPGKRVKITGNVVRGFEFGVFSDARIEDGSSITNNDVHDCKYAFGMSKSNATVDGNRAIDCEYAALGKQGACFRNHGVINCDNLAQDDGRWVMFVNPYFEWGTETIDALGTKYFNIAPATSANRIGGFISSHVASSSQIDTDFSYDVVKWDGSTMTVNSGSWDGLNLSKASGTLTVVAMENAGFLAVRIYSASARTNLRVVAHFNGSILID